MAQLFIKGAAVEDTGEGIVIGLGATLLQMLLELGDLFLGIGELIAKETGALADIIGAFDQLPYQRHRLLDGETLILELQQLVKALVQHTLEVAGAVQGILHAGIQLGHHGFQTLLHGIHVPFGLAGQVLMVEQIAGERTTGPVLGQRTVQCRIELRIGLGDIGVPERIVGRGGGDLVFDHQRHGFFQTGRGFNKALFIVTHGSSPHTGQFFSY